MRRRRREISIDPEIISDTTTDIFWLKLFKISSCIILIVVSVGKSSLGYSLAVLSMIISELISKTRLIKPFSQVHSLIIPPDNPISPNPPANNTPSNHIIKQIIKNMELSSILRFSFYSIYTITWMFSKDKNGMFFVTFSVILICLYFLYGPSSINNFYRETGSHFHRNTSQESTCQVLALILLFMTHFVQYLWWSVELDKDSVGIVVWMIYVCQTTILGLGFYCLQEAVELICLLRGADEVRHGQDDEPLLNLESGEVGGTGNSENMSDNLENENNSEQNVKKLIDPEECYHS